MKKKSTKNCISVIVPVYKTENFLAEAIESILSQSYENLEILLVHNGPIDADNSYNICQDYSKKDERIRLFHIEKSSPAAARNFGLKKVTGDFVGFVDSDDFLDKNFYQELYKAIVKYDTIVAMCALSLYKNNKIKLYWSLNDEEKVFEMSKIAPYIKGWCVNRLYRRDFFKTDDFLFDENYFYEDILFTWQMVCSVETIAYTPKTSYYYRKGHATSVTSQKTGIHLDLVYSTNATKSFLKKSECWMQYKDIFYINFFSVCWTHLRRCPDRLSFVQEIIKICNDMDVPEDAFDFDPFLKKIYIRLKQPGITAPALLKYFKREKMRKKILSGFGLFTKGKRNERNSFIFNDL